MSHKHELKVSINDKESLVNALQEMGFEVKEGRTTLHSRYNFDITTDLTISKDGKEWMVGFLEQEDGTFKLEADFFSTGMSQAQFQKDLNVLHGKHKTTKWFAQNRFTTTYEKDDAGNLVVVGTKW